MSDAVQSNDPRRPILLGYDGSPRALRAVDAAGTLFTDRPVIVLYVASRVAVERVRTTSVAAVRDELIEEVRVAARREAATIAEEGASRARAAGLEAHSLVSMAENTVAETIVRVAIEESAAAVMIGRPQRARRAFRAGGVFRGVLDRCPLPVVVI
jgi:nucleotide-binding universal stress UspA family protein